MRFAVGEHYRNVDNERRTYEVAEIRKEGREGLLRDQEAGGELWFVRADIMETGKWQFVSAPRFEVGAVFQKVADPKHHAIVAEVKSSGREALVRYIGTSGARVLPEEWVLSHEFFASGEWRIPPVER